MSTVLKERTSYLMPDPTGRLDEYGYPAFTLVRVDGAVRCDCYNVVTIDDCMTNTCTRCGADYNGNGSQLAPREQWGEETGETYADIEGPGSRHDPFGEGLADVDGHAVPMDDDPSTLPGKPGTAAWMRAAIGRGWSNDEIDAHLDLVILTGATEDASTGNEEY